MSHIVAVHSLDVYEKFLAIWRDVNEAAALEFEQILNRRLERFGMTRYTVVAASVTVHQTTSSS
jgi:hypothetical protein